MVSSLTNSPQSAGSISACDLCIFNLSDSSIDEAFITCAVAGRLGKQPVAVSTICFPVWLWISRCPVGLWKGHFSNIYIPEEFMALFPLVLASQSSFVEVKDAEFLRKEI